MSDKAWETRRDNHDFMEPAHVAQFLRNHRTGPDNLGRMALAQIIASQAPCTVLDAACGTGVNWEVLHNHNVPCTYTGLDRTARLLAHARDLYGSHEDAEFVQGYVEEMPFDDESKDIVILRHILEHLEEGYEPAITEALRVAAKEVIVVFFLTPNETQEHVLEESEPDKNGCTYHWNTYSWQKFSTFLAGFGYRFTAHHVPTPGAAHADTIVRIYK